MISQKRRTIWTKKTDTTLISSITRLSTPRHILRFQSWWRKAAPECTAQARAGAARARWPPWTWDKRSTPPSCRRCRLCSRRASAGRSGEHRGRCRWARERGSQSTGRWSTGPWSGRRFRSLPSTSWPGCPVRQTDARCCQTLFI